MAFPSKWPPARTRRPFLFSTLAWMLSIGVLSIGVGEVRGQTRREITVEALIGDAISDSASNYPDVDAAIRRFMNRDVLATRTLLERANQKSPHLPPVDLTLAKLYYMTGQTALGNGALELTSQSNPGDPEPYLILADRAYTQGRLIEADALYEKAIRLIDSFTGNEKRKRNFVIRSRAGRAAVAGVRRDWEPAIEDLQVWVQADPESANAHQRLGRALFMSGKTEEGFKELAKAHELEDKLPNPYVSAATLHAEMGDDNAARQNFERAVRQDRDNVETLLAYSHWLLQSGDLETAEKSLAAARRADADSTQVLVLSGVAAQMGKKRKPAEDYYLAALAQAPGNRDVLNQLALLLAEQMDDTSRQRALQYAKMNAELYSDSADTNLTLAWVLYRIGQTQSADKALKKGVQLGGRSPDSSYLVARMLADQNQNDNAKRLLEDALKNKSGIFVYRADAQTLLNSIN